MKVKTKFTKRILSFVLAFCMLAALVPAMPAAEAATEEGRYHVFDFRKAYQETYSGINNYPPLITYEMTTSNGGDSELNKDVYSDPWAAHDLAKESTTGAYCYLYGPALNMGMRMHFPSTASKSFSIKVQVQENGTYMPVLKVVGNTKDSLGGINATITFSKLNADNSLTKISEATNVDANAIDGPFSVELANAPISMAQGEEYVISVSGNGVYEGGTNDKSIWLQKLELVNNYEAKLVVSPEGTKAPKLFYDFTVLNDQEHFDNQTAVNAITYADTMEKSSAPWKIYSYMIGRQGRMNFFIKDDDKGFYYNKAGSGLTTVTLADSIVNGIDGAGYFTGSIMIHVPVSGKYVVKFTGGCNFMNNSSYSLIPLRSNRVPGDPNLTHAQNWDNISVKNTNANSTEFVFNNGEAIELAAGEYILYTYHQAGCHFDNLTLTPEGWVESIEANDIFGSKYAYVQKTGDTYTLHFVGGLNKIEGYAKAGFEIVGTDEVAETNEVYDSLSVNGTSYAASAYEANYVFCATKAGIEPGRTITIKPYIEDAEGNRTYHTYGEGYVEFEITLPSA